MRSTFESGRRVAANRRERPARRRVKAVALTLGSTRLRLIQVLHHLGLYRAAIEARARDRQRAAQRLEQQRHAAIEEARRIARMREELEVARRLEEQRSAGRLARQRLDRLLAEERSAHELEQRRFVLLLKEEIAFASMTEAQKAADRFEEQVVSWLTSGDPEPP